MTKVKKNLVSSPCCVNYTKVSANVAECLPLHHKEVHTITSLLPFIIEVSMNKQLLPSSKKKLLKL